MKRIEFSLLINFISIVTFAQQSDDLSFFKMNNDTMIMYLNNVGDITTKSNALFYRKAIIDKETFIYNGIVKDYFINGKEAFHVTFENAEMNGFTERFYENGQKKYQGFYKNSLKDSLWNFYYKNGNVEKNVIYKSDTPYVKDYYKANGKCIFSNGNGKYNGTILNFKGITNSTISGKIKNGRFDGSWGWDNFNSTELFKNGVFIKGNSHGAEYTANPKISLTGFDLHENVDFYKFIVVPNSGNVNYIFSQMLKYRNSNNLNNTFYPEFLKYIQDLNTKFTLGNYRCYIQFIVNKENEIQDLDIVSDNEYVKYYLRLFIQKCNNFEAAKPDDKPVDCSVFICLYYVNGKVYIPEYTTANGFNIMKFIPEN